MSLGQHIPYKFDTRTVVKCFNRMLLHVIFLLFCRIACIKTILFPGCTTSSKRAWSYLFTLLMYLLYKYEWMFKHNMIFPSIYMYTMNHFAIKCTRCSFRVIKDLLDTPSETSILSLFL